VKVSVEAERWHSRQTPVVGSGHGERVKVTEAEVVLVAVDDRWRPVPIKPEVTA
jgi:acyl-CoA thioesterase FadM